MKNDMRRLCQIINNSITCDLAEVTLSLVRGMAVLAMVVFCTLGCAMPSYAQPIEDAKRFYDSNNPTKYKKWVGGGYHDYDLTNNRCDGTKVVECYFPSTTFFYSEAYKAVEEVNRRRRENGKPELIVKDNLMRAGMQRALECMACYNHTRPDGSSPSSVVNVGGYSEGIGGGWTAVTAVDAQWRESAHRNNMLNEKYQYIGIGAVSTGDNCPSVWVFVYIEGGYQMKENQDLINNPDPNYAYPACAELQPDGRYIYTYNDYGELRTIDYTKERQERMLDWDSIPGGQLKDFTDEGHFMCNPDELDFQYKERPANLLSGPYGARFCKVGEVPYEYQQEQQRKAEEAKRAAKAQNNTQITWQRMFSNKGRIIIYATRNGEILRQTGVIDWNGYKCLIANGMLYTAPIIYQDKSDGKWKYFVNGVQVQKCDTLVYQYGKYWHIKNGELCTEPGFVRYKGTYVFCYQGSAATFYTGWIRYAGYRCYLQRGVLKTYRR